MWQSALQSFKEKYASVSGNYGLSLWIGLGVLAAVYFIQQYRKRSKLPPGPVGLPILGYYFPFRREPLKELHNLAERYGSVVGLYIGPQYFVFLNDWEAMKDAMSQNAILDRPASLFEGVPYNLGFAGKNGEKWIQTRRLTSKAMKDVGLHSTRWEELVQEEALDLVDRIAKEGDRPIELRSFFAETFANNIMSLVLGERLGESEHFDTKSVAAAVDAIVESTTTLSMRNGSPVLWKILQALGVEKKVSLQKEMDELASAVSNLVDEKMKSKNSESKDTFIDRLEEEIENHYKNKGSTEITGDDLKGTVIGLLTGGSDTSRTTIIWLLIAMAENPGIQRKVHEELDRVIGKDGCVRWSDRFKIPYTFAAFLESMRWQSVAPLTGLRQAAEDCQIRGYHIPKGSLVTANNWAIHSDTRYWDKPDQFVPERFLEENGTKVNSSPDSYNPFSYGKRNCPGKLIAMMENLQYFTVLMQKFKVLPKEGDKCEYRTIFGLTYEVSHVKVRFVPR